MHTSMRRMLTRPHFKNPTTNEHTATRGRVERALGKSDGPGVGEKRRRGKCQTQMHILPWRRGRDENNDCANRRLDR
jgi:hypothetical protein